MTIRVTDHVMNLEIDKASRPLGSASTTHRRQRRMNPLHLPHSLFTRNRGDHHLEARRAPRREMR